jgi:hypothetical protein
MSKQWGSFCLLATTVTLIACAVAAATVPQGEATTWFRVFGGPDRGALFAVTPAGEDHLIAAGATRHSHTPPYSGDVLLMKVDLADGSVVWEGTWGGDGYEQAWGIAPAPGGGFYVFGETDSYGAGNRDFFLLKVDADGSQVWFHTYGTPEREWPFGMLVLASGDLLMYGEIRGEDESEDPFAVRVDPAGDVVWEYRDQSAANSFFLDALETAAGQIILCTAVDEDAALTALESDGSQAWAQRYELDGWQYASAIETAGDGYLLAGFAMIENTESRQADVWLVKASRNGELVWQRSFGEADSDDYAMNMLRLSDETYLIGGFGRGMPLWKIGASGDVLWERRLFDSASFANGAIIELSDGGFVAAGLKFIVSARSSDAVLLRTDAEGRAGGFEER